MKKNICVVPGCTSTDASNDSLKFHQIPKDAEVRKKWLKAINRTEPEINKKSRVCSKHFKNQDYAVTRFNYMGAKNAPSGSKNTCEIKALKNEAVPNLLLPQKSTFKIKISKKDSGKQIKVEEVKVKEEKVDKPEKSEKVRMPKRPAVEMSPPRARTQSRRAASKEALKQMQLLLDDENDAVEIPDDDYFLDIIPIDPTPPPPPKKKYKLSHRKSSDGNDRDVIVLKTITNRDAENTLELDCWVEPLEESQKNRVQKFKDDEKEIQAKLDSLISQCSAKVIHKGDLHTIIEVAEQVQSAIQGSQAPPTSLILNNNMGGQQSYQLVMDPRMGLVVGAINNPQPPPPPPQKVYQGKVQVAQNLQQAPTPSPSTTPARGNTRTRNRSAAKMTPPPPPVITQTRTPVPQTRNQATPQTRGQATTLQTRAQATTPQTRAQATTPLTRAQATPPTRAQATPPTRAQATPPTRAQATPPTRAQAAPPTRAQATPPTRAQATAPQTRGQATVTQTRTQAAAPQTRAQATPPQTRETRGQAGTVQTRVQAKKVVAAAVAAPPPPAVTTRGRGHPPANAFSSTVRPDETNVQGGLATGGKKVVVDLTADDTNRSAPDSREIAFNKLQGKTYPSLVVVARPHLRVQDLSLDRPKLDAKVKSVLMHAPTKFTEWLIQQGLIRSEQKCTAHATTQLKLGMYSDVSKFPYSGGYVWISECCPQRFVSVFSGSLFEGSPHPPLVILKLLYHWSCQTNIQNVTQWVKVDNLYVKGMFTWLRSICTVALHTHIRQIGGPGIKVEVGVISLGTTSQDGNQRQVKVEVLGVLESESKLIRLRAVEPQSEGDRNYKKRFSKILEPVCRWVHPQSILVADLTVDKQTLVSMGFQNVVQYSSNQYGNNNQIMEYLRRIVPRMFQNTLSLLSRQIIQQFLDELVWREWFGTSSLQAFDNLVTHLSEQTRFESGGQSLIVRLNKVAQNPFKSWAISVSSATKAVESTPTTVNANANKKQRSARKPDPPKVPTTKSPHTFLSSLKVTTPTVVAQDARPPKSTSPDVPEHMVPLESYYYGTIDTYSKTPTITLNMKCPFCKSSFDNNIQLMSHLFKHAHNVSMDAQLCRYCLTSVATANDLLKHIATSHPAETKFDNGFCCLICETQYMNPFVLGKHMSKEHYPSELPYQCGTCSYRCSNHKQAIDHFYRTHDNGPTIQCPFCLKSTTVFTASRNIVQNMNYFIQHLQKHQRKQFARRCGKCNLWFVQKDVLKEHQNKMHVSQRGKNGLVSWTAPRNGIMVPKSKMDKYPVDAEVINFATLKFDLSTGLMCKECNTPMDTPKHFPSFESCQNPNCQYSTCCTNAMQEHNAKCSKTSNPISEGKLPFEMFCICGFSNLDGNQMARHLAICERKSAYPSRTDAQTATVTHSMLDVLGLVRRPEEKPKPQKSKKMKKDSSFDKTDEVMPDATVTKPTTTEEQKKDAEDTTKSKNVAKTNKKVMLDEDTSKKEVQIIDDDNKMDEGVANETAVVQNDTAAEDKDKEEKMEVDDMEAKENIAIDKESTEAKDEQTVDKDTVITGDKRDGEADLEENEEINANKDTIDEEKVKDDLDESKEIEAEVKEPSLFKDLEEASNKIDLKSPENQSKDLEDNEENPEVQKAMKDKSEEQSIEKECEEDDEEKVSEKPESRVTSPNKETEELKDDNRDTIDLDNDTKGSEELEDDKKEFDEVEPESDTKEIKELEDDPKESEELADDPKELEELVDDPKESEELADDLKESEEHDNDKKETEDIECVTKETEELESGTKETEELGDKKDSEELEDDKIESESLGDDKIESESIEDDKIESESLGDDKIESESIEDDKIESESLGDDKIESESIEDDKKESSEPQADFENKESSENETEDVENDAEVLEDNHDKAPVVRSLDNELEDYEEDTEKESESLEKSDDKEPETLEDFEDKEPAVKESKDDEKESEDDEKESEDIIDQESVTKSPTEKEDDEKESEDIIDRESLTKSPAEKEDDEDESEPQLDDFEEDKEPKDDVSSEKDIDDAIKEREPELESAEREPELESAEREPDLEPSEREQEDLDDLEKVAIDYRKEPESDLSNHVSEPETNMETSEMVSDKEPPAMTSDYIQNLLSDVARSGDETSVMETDGDGKQSDDVNMASPSEMMDVPDVGGDAPTPMETD